MKEKKTPNETDVLVGGRVRLRRRELGLSQTELGGRLGITFQQVQKYEKGSNRIGASRLHAIAAILNVPVGYFFPLEEEGPGGGTTAQPAEVLGLLSMAGALDLLRDFARITNPATRKALRGVVAALAGAPEQNDAASVQARH